MEIAWHRLITTFGFPCANNYRKFWRERDSRWRRHLAEVFNSLLKAFSCKKIWTMRLLAEFECVGEFSSLPSLFTLTRSHMWMIRVCVVSFFFSFLSHVLTLSGFAIDLVVIRLVVKIRCFASHTELLRTRYTRRLPARLCFESE